MSREGRDRIVEPSLGNTPGTQRLMDVLTKQRRIAELRLCSVGCVMERLRALHLRSETAMPRNRMR